MAAHAAPIFLDFEEGTDRKTLRRLRDRFLTINQQRWNRAHSALPYSQQRVLEILPLVFHLNHPALPGYLDSDCPYGLGNYKPSSTAIKAARKLARTFSLKDEGKRQPDLDAMFLMGSPGTLGHSAVSDLDVWLCHRPSVPERGIRCLERKADKLTRWAKSRGVDLHVFVFSAPDLRAGRQRAEVTGENCGSAQHFLLLDEFYRTSIHLAGAWPTWWLIPADNETDYDNCRRKLVDFRFVDAEDYIDFGPVPSIPEAEFLGAGVWQLYKGIDAPWKSILKLVLIECYARTTDQGLLSGEFKRAVFRGETDADRLDPYVMLYDRIEDLLAGPEVAARLDLIRRSLYLKAGLPLTRIKASGEQWRPRLLRQLITRWGWPESTLAELDERERWRAEDVTALHRTVVNELTHGYRLLSKMARAHGEPAAISAMDINLLGRKLYVAFQREAGKIEQINPGLVPSLAEENLAFRHQSDQGGDANGWLLYRDLENPAVIRRSSNLAELMLWSYCNGLLTRSTRLGLRSGKGAASVGELQGIFRALAGFLPAPFAPAEPKALLQDARLLKNLLLVNVGIDPQARLTERGLHKLSSRHDSLGFSGSRENLVISIDQISVNSWHEVRLQHYAAGDTLIQCLKHVLTSVAAHPADLPDIQVHCHSRGHGPAIARRIKELFADVLRSFFAGGVGPHPVRYVIEVGRRYFLLQFNSLEPVFVALENLGSLMEYLALPQERYLPVVFDRRALPQEPALRAVCRASEPDSIQVFYHILDNQVRFWVVDERGSVFSWQQRVLHRRLMLVPLLRFFNNLSERHLSRHSASAGGVADVQCYEVMQRNGIWRGEYRPESDSGAPLSGPEVRAVGVRESDGPLRFDMVCGGQTFTVQEHGDQLMPAVAHYIRSLHVSDAVCQVHLTDIYLPRDPDSEADQQRIQTSQYLYYRSVLENLLNRHLVMAR